MEVKVYGSKEKTGAKLGTWNEEPRRIEPKPIGEKAKKKAPETAR